MRRSLVSLFVLGLAVSPALEAAPLPLSLLDDRFLVEAEWRTAGGATGFGTPVSLTRETGYFWFFSPTNIEVVVKVLDACSSPAPRFWVFAGGLTDTEVTLTVTDEATGEKKTYRNPQGMPFQPIQDTAAFATCAVVRCGQGISADLAASPRARPDLEALASAMTGALAAPQAVYDRVVADVAAIGRQNASLSEIPFQRNFVTTSLYLEVDFETGLTIAGGDYTPWDCLNQRYGVRQVSQYAPSTIVRLVFDKVLDTRRLVADYETLPGVIKAEPEYAYQFPVLGPPLLLSSYCGRIEGDLYKYFIRLTNGSIFHYTSRPGAAPIAAGSTLGNPESSWLAEAQACFSDHVNPRA